MLNKGILEFCCELIHLFSSQLMHGIPYDGQSHNCLHKLSATCFGYGNISLCYQVTLQILWPKVLVDPPIQSILGCSRTAQC